MVRRLILILIMLAWSAPAATIIVPPGGSLQSAIDRAANGDRIELLNGTHTGGANFRGKTGIQVRAANSGQAILSGSQVVMDGIDCSLAGVIVTGVRTSWNTGAVLITGRANTLLDCFIHDNESLGIDISGGDLTTIENVRSNHNGNLGLNTGSPAAGNNVEGLVIRNSEFRDNNYGMDAPIWAGIAGKTVKGTDGKWYRGAGDAAGGVKICNANDVLVENVEISGNVGAGLWFDVYCGKKTIRGVHSHGQKSIPGDPAYFAVGIEIELEKDGVSLIENCFSHDNAGSSFAIFEASNVTIRNCQGDNVELRDLGGGREAYRPRNILLDGVKLRRGVGYPNDRTRAEVRMINVQTNLASLPAWTMPGSTSPPATRPTPTQPAAESPDGAIIANPGQQIVDSSGNVWGLTAARKITRNGVEQPETNGVAELRYVSGVVYQTAHSLWWKWTGTGWLLTTAPTMPATQPADPTVELRTKIAQLEQQLSDEKAARASDSAVITGLQAELAAAREKLSQIHQLSQP